MSEPQTLCAHCGDPVRGTAWVGESPVCHPDQGLDCYRLVTVYGEPLGSRRVASVDDAARILGSDWTDGLSSVEWVRQQRDAPQPPPTLADLLRQIEALPREPFADYLGRRYECPEGPHRGPEGPNEDISQCGRCLSITYAMRPDDEEWGGGHIADCSLPRRHESYCEPGGSGHPPAPVQRG